MEHIIKTKIKQHENLSREDMDILHMEMIPFNDNDRKSLTVMLWAYILNNRYTTNHNTSIVVGSAIRKYIANMPMEKMDSLSILLKEPIDKSYMKVELEIEIIKMIYRNLECIPQSELDPYPKLSKLLFDIVQLYTKPRILLGDNKYSSVASLAIMAIIAMRSPFAKQVLDISRKCPSWFSEIVYDDLDDLRSRWIDKLRKISYTDHVEWPDHVKWLDNLRYEK